MASFPLKILTPGGSAFDGRADKLIVRTVSGDMAVLPRHINCVCPLGSGPAVVETQDFRRTGRCSGGFLSVIDGDVVMITRNFSWDRE